MLAGLQACTDRELSHAPVVAQTGSVAAARYGLYALGYICSVSLHTYRLTGSGALDILHACAALRFHSLSALHQWSQQAISVCVVKLSGCMSNVLWKAVNLGEGVITPCV